MDRMGVDAVMCNLPELKLAIGHSLCDRIHVTEGIVVWMLLLVNGISTPSVAFIRPYGSQSSCMALGCIGIVTFSKLATAAAPVPPPVR